MRESTMYTAIGRWRKAIAAMLAIVFAFALSGFATQNAWADDAGGITVEVLSPAGDIEKSVALTAEQIAGKVDAEAPAALFQYYKSDEWSVLRSTNYITFEDLFSLADIEVDKANDVVTIDNYSKWSGATIDQMKEGRFYPAASVVDNALVAGDGSYTVPAGIALTLSSGSGDTPAAALSAAEEATAGSTGCPRVLLGILDDGQYAGNRSAQNVEKVVLQRADPVVFSIDVIGTDGETVESSFEVKKSQFLSKVKSSAPVALFQYYKSDKWSVLRSSNYVTFADLFALAGVEVDKANDVVKIGGYGKWAGATLEQLEVGEFYPNASFDEQGALVVGDDGYTVPAGIALTLSSGTGATAAAALTEAAGKEETAGGCPRVLLGIYDNTYGGNRSAQGVEKIYLQRVAAATDDNSGTDTPGEGTSGSGDEPAKTDPASQAITTAVKANVAKTYGDKAFKLGAKAQTALSYTSDKPKVASVDKNGTVTIKGAGTAKITITAAATDAYKKATKTVTVKVAKAAVVVKAKTVKAKAKAKTTVKKAKAFTVSKASGTVTFKKTSGNKKITVSKAGKVTVKKGLKKGKTYKVKVKATAKGNANYRSGSKTVTLKIVVK